MTQSHVVDFFFMCLDHRASNDFCLAYPRQLVLSSQQLNAVVGPGVVGDAWMATSVFSSVQR